jgi:hypothetical protein
LPQSSFDWQFSLAATALYSDVGIFYAWTRLDDIRSERIASNVEERHIAFPIIAGIVGIALVVGYAGYCFYSTAEMIKPYKKIYEKLGINLPRSFEKPTGVNRRAW